jgi:lysozyme
VQGRGLGSGCKSTAAGRYQIIKPTWLSLKSKLGLPDFSPASQDAAAIELIRQRGALADVQAGRIESAVNKCAKVWASLPGAGYGQREVKLQNFISNYQAEGGALA